MFKLNKFLTKHGAQLWPVLTDRAPCLLKPVITYSRPSALAKQKYIVKHSNSLVKHTGICILILSVVAIIFLVVITLYTFYENAAFLESYLSLTHDLINGILRRTNSKGTGLELCYNREPILKLLFDEGIDCPVPHVLSGKIASSENS